MASCCRGCCTDPPRLSGLVGQALKLEREPATGDRDGHSTGEPDAPGPHDCRDSVIGAEDSFRTETVRAVAASPDQTQHV